LIDWFLVKHSFKGDRGGGAGGGRKLGTQSICVLYDMEFSHPVNALISVWWSAASTQIAQGNYRTFVFIHTLNGLNPHTGLRPLRTVKRSRTPAPTACLECRNTSCPYPAAALKDKLFAW